MRLFISYAHVDKAIVDDWIVRTLRAGHHEVWIDESLSAGMEWKPQLADAIEASDALVYAMTPESVSSETCHWEVLTAIKLGKKVVPVLLQARTRIPEWLSVIQYVDFSEGATGDAVAKLIGGLQRLTTAQVALVPPVSDDNQGQSVSIARSISLETNERPQKMTTVGTKRSSAIIKVLGGIFGIVVGLATLFGILPETTRNHIFETIGLISLATATPTKAIPTAFAPVVEALNDLEIRTGPGANFLPKSKLFAGNILDVLGITVDGLWYQVLLSDGTTGWILNRTTDVSLRGNRAVLLVISPTLTPTYTAMLTQVPTDSQLPTSTTLPSQTATATSMATNTQTASATNEPTNKPTELPTFTSTNNTNPLAAPTNTVQESTPISVEANSVCQNEFKLPMVFVAETTIFMGLSDDQPGPSNERPGRNVTISSFCMDVYEVTNARYTNCMNDGACTAPQRTDSTLYSDYFSSSNFSRFPVVNIIWSQAQKYCEYQGGRLPTEAEWELAARHDPATGEMRTYPWGTLSPNPSRANYIGRGIGDTVEVGQHPEGASPYGVFDLSGNVAEWVFDWFGAYSSKSVVNPMGPENGTQRVIRGGSFASDTEGIRGGYRGSQSPTVESNQIGFRCVVPVR